MHEMFDGGLIELVKSSLDMTIQDMWNQPEMSGHEATMVSPEGWRSCHDFGLFTPHPWWCTLYHAGLRAEAQSFIHAATRPPPTLAENRSP